MTLEVLSKPTPAEPPMNSGGRSAGEQDGGADGFSTALSRAGKRSSSSADKDRDGSAAPQQTQADTADAPVAGDRRSVRTALREAGEHSVEDRSETKRTLISADFPNPKVQVQRTLNSDKTVVGAEDKATENAEAEDETVLVNADQAGGASDLLSILAGLNSANVISAANAGTMRSGPAGEGRKPTAAIGESEQKSGIDADGKAARNGDAALLEMPTADAVEAGPERDFKFINAKNGSLNAELTQAARSSERDGAEPKTAASSVENVMVLDSRRIVGLPSGSNSASLMAAMVGDQSWSAAMQPDATLSNIAAQSSSGSVVHMLKLQMNPHDLGAVTATLKMSGEHLHVHLTVETRAALQQLSEDSSGMLDALRAQGFSVEQVTISVAPTADTNNQKGQPDAQTGQQQMAGNGERQGGSSQGQSGERFDETVDSRNFEHDSSLDTSAAFAPGTADGARAGQLYL